MVFNSKIVNKFPFLPTMPHKIYGTTVEQKRITNRISSEWEFYPFAIDNIPSPFSDNQNYDFSAVDNAKWCEIIAPSSAIMQGFDIKNNTEYYYRTTLDVKSVKGASPYLRFEGVYCNCRVWINNKYVTTHLGGFTPFDIKIDKGINDIVIGFADIEGETVGVWNEKGENISDASWASYYAHNNIGGIIRDISLYYLPSNFIAKERYDTKISGVDGNINGEIIVKSSSNCKIVLEVFKGDICLCRKEINTSKSCEIQKSNNFWYQLETDNSKQKSDCKYTDCFVPYENCEDYLYTQSFEFSLTIKNANFWTAESPNLYKLATTLYVDNSETQTNERYIGIREITYGGAAGTQKNMLYVNGKQVKLRGVCRHDISYNYGRSITAEEELEEVLAYKRNNVNFVRTSHYPASRNFVELCDKYGLYVEMENSVCFKSANGYPMLCSSEQIMQNLFEMLTYYINNCSVIIWSIANESGFEGSVAFRQSYEQIKTIDLSRPTIFSYPFTIKSKPIPYDIFSKHYNKVYTNVGKIDFPMLHDEFAHIACYNINELSRDNNVRLNWAESINMGWENIFYTDGALGCALWGGIDEVFYIPSGTNCSHQKHTSGSAVGYGEWGAILDVFKREKPEAYLTKKAFTPIKINDIALNGNKLSIKLSNRFDHTNIDKIKLIVKSKDCIIFDSILKENIAPHSDGVVGIELNNYKNDALILEFYHEGFLVECERLDVGFNPKIALSHSGNKITVDDKNAKINIISGKNILADGPYLVVNDKILQSLSRKIIAHKNADEIIIKETFSFFGKAIYKIFIKENELIISIKLSQAIRNAINVDFGCAFTIYDEIESVAWNKKCLYNYYPENHLDRPIGVAKRTTKPNDYGKVCSANWKDDEINYFLNDKSTDIFPVSNDFKTKRTNINNYTVNIGIDKQFTISKLSQEVDALAVVEPKNISAIKLANAKKQGAWKVFNKGTGKEYYYCKKNNSSMEFDFEGIGLTISGTRSKSQGDFKIFVDGKSERVSTKSDICDTLNFAILYSVSKLKNCKHKVLIVACDDKGFKFSNINVITSSNLIENKIFITKGNYTPSLAWGNYYGKKLKNQEKKFMEFKIQL